MKKFRAKCVFTGKTVTLSIFNDTDNTDSAYNYANVAAAILRLQNGYCEAFDGINADLAVSNEALLDICEYMYSKYKSTHVAFMIERLKAQIKSNQQEHLKSLIEPLEGNTFHQYEKDDCYGVGLDECRFGYGEHTVTGGNEFNRTETEHNKDYNHNEFAD